MRLLAKGLVALSTLGAFVGCSSDASQGDSASSNQTTGLKRPPQFVVLAFDGSLNLDFWQASLDFAKSQTPPVKFTYFASGVYFLANANKSLYNAPAGHGPGKSDIGFGGPAANIPPRVGFMNRAVREGHEIGSHANGHYDGSKWTHDDWASEFDQWNTLIFQPGKNSNVQTEKLLYGQDDVVGFRAPLLGQDPALYQVLSANGFKYDTSKVAQTNYWPQKIGGIWNFPLASLRIVGSGKKTLSMDYNFLFAQSAGKSDPNTDNYATYEKEMYDTYMKYFHDNYFGNRAPVHIGHHFAQWNGGAYWKAMQHFAKSVCSQEEVKCVTYKELMAFMEANAANRDAYQACTATKCAFPLKEHPPGVSVSDGSDVEPAPDAADVPSHSDDDEDATDATDTTP